MANYTGAAIGRPDSLRQRLHQMQVNLLTSLSRDVQTPHYGGGTEAATLENSLDLLRMTVPGFLQMVEGKDVLDFGCGWGVQATALAQARAKSVVGLDLPRPVLENAWQERAKLGLKNLSFTTELPADGRFDVVISCSAFEHYDDPAHILGLMRAHTKPGGLVIISFAEPWWSPRGSHMDGFTRVPWVNLLFNEAAVMEVRSRYKSDGARRYEEVEGGLNRMTVARFESIVRNSGMKVRDLRLFATKKLPLVTSIPGVRELLTSSASCVLERL